MKILQISLAWVALFALMVPCAHADEHHESDAVVAELCATDHADCHACSDVPCSESTQILSVPLVSSLEVPAQKMEISTVFEIARPIFMPASRPPGELLFLRTVQLLI